MQRLAVPQCVAAYVIAVDGFLAEHSPGEIKRAFAEAFSLQFEDHFREEYKRAYEIEYAAAFSEEFSKRWSGSERIGE